MHRRARALEDSLERGGHAHRDRLAGCGRLSSLGSRPRHLLSWPPPPSLWEKRTSIPRKTPSEVHRRLRSDTLSPSSWPWPFTAPRLVCLWLRRLRCPPALSSAPQPRRMVCHWIAVPLGTFPSLSADFYSRQFLRCLALCATERGARFSRHPPSRRALKGEVGTPPFPDGTRTLDRNRSKPVRTDREGRNPGRICW